MKLFPHQEQVLNETKDKTHVAYYLDMGLGKTFIGAEKMVSFNNNLNLIICQKSKVQDWIEHFNTYYSEHPYLYMVYDLTDKKQMSLFFQNYEEAENEELDPRQFIGIVNYELAWRRKDLLKLHDFTLMLDESSLIQNQKAKQTKFVLKLHPTNVILLSGTPTAGKYENLWTQIHLLGWDISENVYNRHYVNWKKIESDEVVHNIVDKDQPYKNVERLKRKLREHGAVFMKTEECFDLPSQTVKIVNVPSTAQYSKFMKHSVITIDGCILKGDSLLAKRLICRQLCSYYNQHKLSAFKELVESTQDRLIVFYNFNAELNVLKNIAASLDRPISEVNGHCKDLTAYEQEEDSITFIQYQAGAMGLNLQKANKLIYFSLTEKSDLFEQSKKRIHRIGQDRPCFYYILQCNRTVEEVIWQTLQMRKDFTDELFRDWSEAKQ